MNFESDDEEVDEVGETGHELGENGEEPEYGEDGDESFFFAYTLNKDSMYVFTSSYIFIHFVSPNIAARAKERE